MTRFVDPLGSFSPTSWRGVGITFAVWVAMGAFGVSMTAWHMTFLTAAFIGWLALPQSTFDAIVRREYDNRGSGGTADLTSKRLVQFGIFSAVLAFVLGLASIRWGTLTCAGLGSLASCIARCRMQSQREAEHFGAGKVVAN